MKKILFTFCLTIVSVFVYSQTQSASYIVVSKGDIYDSEVIKEVVESGEMDTYRLNTAKRALKFNDGTKIVLMPNNTVGLPLKQNEKYSDKTEYPNVIKLSQRQDGSLVIVEQVAYSGKPYQF